MARVRPFALGPADTIVYPSTPLLSSPPLSFVTSTLSSWMRNCLNTFVDVFRHTQYEVTEANMIRGNELLASRSDFSVVEERKGRGEERGGEDLIDSITFARHLYPILRTACGRYIQAIRSAAQEASAEADAAGASIVEGDDDAETRRMLAVNAALEGETLQITACLLHALDIIYLADDGEALVGLTAWIREYWMPLMDAGEMASLLSRMAGDTAIIDKALHEEVWLLGLQLVASGQPHEAAKYLSVLAGLLRDPTVVDLADLLASMPPLVASSVEAGAKPAYVHAWQQWKTHVASARTEGLCDGYAVASLILDLLASSDPGKTLSSPRILEHERTAVLSHWSYQAVCQVLYAQPPVTVSRQSFHVVLARCMRASGIELDSAASLSANAGQVDETSLLSACISFFQGDLGRGIAVVQQLGQTFAAAAMGDLFWHAGLLFNPLVWPAWKAPTRAHLVLDLAAQWVTLENNTLPFVRQAVFLLECIKPDVVHDQYKALNVSAAGETYFRLAKMSGSARQAQDMATFLLERCQVDDEKELFKLIALCREAKVQDLVVVIQKRFARRLLSAPGACLGEEGRLSGIGRSLAIAVALEDVVIIEAACENLLDQLFSSEWVDGWLELVLERVDAALIVGLRFDVRRAHVELHDAGGTWETKARAFLEKCMPASAVRYCGSLRVSRLLFLRAFLFCAGVVSRFDKSAVEQGSTQAVGEAYGYIASSFIRRICGLSAPLPSPTWESCFPSVGSLFSKADIARMLQYADRCGVSSWTPSQEKVERSTGTSSKEVVVEDVDAWLLTTLCAAPR